MLRSEIHVDLPSEAIERKKSLVTWFKSSTGNEPEREADQEELTLSCVQVVQAIMVCFHKVDIENAIALIIDGTVVFVDEDGDDDDAAKLLQAAIDHGSSLDHFSELVLVMEDRRQGLHSILEVTVHSSVKVGEKELTISITGRPDLITHVGGETALDYAKRLVAFAHGEALFDAIGVMEKLASEVAQQFQVQIGIYKVSQGAVEAALVRPNGDAIAAFGNLDFVGGKPPGYHGRPTSAHPDSFCRYYDDPLYPYQSFVLIAQIVQQSAWSEVAVQVLAEDGSEWACSDEVGAEHRDNWSQTPELQFSGDDHVIVVSAP